jgi:hypothetical protein
VLKKQFPVTEPTAAVFQVFLGAAEAAVGISPVSVATVTGGAVRRTMQAALAAAAWATTESVCAATASARRKGCQFVASGIKNGGEFNPERSETKP